MDFTNLHNMYNTVIVRRLYEGDRFGLLLMRQKLWPRCSKEQHQKEISHWLREPDVFPVFVAEESEGNLIGFIEVSIHHNEPYSSSPSVLYIGGWFVETMSRRNHVGKKLLLAAEEWGRAKDLTEIFSDTEIENEISQLIHRNLGFTEVHRDGACIFYKKAL